MRMRLPGSRARSAARDRLARGRADPPRRRCGRGGGRAGRRGRRLGEPPRQPAVAAARQPLDRRPRQAVARDARRRRGRGRDRGAGASVDAKRAEGAGGGDRAARARGRADRAGARLLPHVQRLRRPVRRPRARDRRQEPRCPRRLRGQGRHSGRRRSEGRRSSCSRAAVSDGRTFGFPGSPARVSRWRSSTPASIACTRTSGARCSRASTCSTRVAMRARGRTRPRRDDRSVTERRWPGSSSARTARPGSKAPRPVRRCSRSASPAGSRTRPAESPSTDAPTRFSPGSSSPSTRTRTGTRTTRHAWRSSVSSSRSPRSSTARWPRRPPGATALDTLVVAPAGNDGPAGPAYGSIGGPGGAPRVLTAGALDTRRRSPTGHVLLLAGLRTLVSGNQPLGGVVAPGLSVSAPVVALPRAAAGGRRCTGRLQPALRQRRVQPRRRCRRPAASRDVVTGGRARGRCCRRSRGARRRSTSRRIARHRRAGRGSDPRALGRERRGRAGSTPPGRAGRLLALAPHRSTPTPTAEARRPFSSEGLAFDGAQKPEVNAAGIGLATSDPGPRRRRRRALRHAERLERGCGADRGCSRPARPGSTRPRRCRAQAGARGERETRARAAWSGRSTRRVPLRSRSLRSRRSSPSAPSFAEDTQVGRVITLRNTSRRAVTVAIRPGNGGQRRHRGRCRTDERTPPSRRDRAGRGHGARAAPPARARRSPGGARRHRAGRGDAEGPLDDHRARRRPRPDSRTSVSRAGRSSPPTSSRQCSRSRSAASTGAPIARSFCPSRRLRLELYRGRPANRPARARPRSSPGPVLVRDHRAGQQRQAASPGQLRAAGHRDPGRRRVPERGGGPVRDRVSARRATAASTAL